MRLKSDNPNTRWNTTDWGSEFSRFDKSRKKWKNSRSSSSASSGYSSAENGRMQMRDYRDKPRQTDHTPYRVSAAEIFSTLQQLGCEPEDRHTGIQARFCPICHKPHNNERTNMYTFGVDKGAGFFNCFRCNQSGTWNQLLQMVGLAKNH